MTLTLDHIQRLNLHAILGAQRGDVATIRAVWATQDKLMLSPEEEKAVELKRDVVAGQERLVWNHSLTIPAKEFEFSESEWVRLKASLQAWDWYGVNADRRWLQPILDALDLSNANGN